jgi:hypothetical protein
MKRMIWIWIVSAILGIIAAHLLYSVALAQEQAIIKASPLIPPPEYDHPFTGVLTVTRVSGRVNMDQICRKPRAIGCASYYTVGGCRIWVLDDYGLEHQLVSPVTYLQVYRHEVAHCNGWPADHPTHEELLARNRAMSYPIMTLVPPHLLVGDSFVLRWGEW